MTEIANIQHRFGDYLFNFIKKKVPSVDDAQDIYQDVIYKIMSKSNQLNKTQSLKSWLFTIAKNQITDYYRTKRHIIDVDVLSDDLIQQSEMKGYLELEGCLNGFIEALPDDYKKLIILSEIEGKSQKELSKSLGMNYVTVRSKVQRGREKIKKMIFDACIIELDSQGRFVDCMPKPDGSSCNNQDSCDN